MPLPKPKPKETEDDFIKRCMSNDLMNEEYEDNDRRLAVCYTQWRNREGKSMDFQKADLIETKPEDGYRAYKLVERKSILLELKENKEGSFMARIATLNVIDKDGDVTLSGAFPDGREVLVSAYQHESWMGALPVGKAVIHESGDDVIADGEFNLKTETGREHYEAVKFSGGLQEWSYGFKVEEEDKEDRDGQKVRLLKKLVPYEISPVLLGAGIDTGTLAIKQEKSTYIDQAEAVLAAVNDLVARTKSLADLRREDGRDLSNANRERMKIFLIHLSEIALDLKNLLDATEPVDIEAQAILLFTKIKRTMEEN